MRLILGVPDILVKGRVSRVVRREKGMELGLGMEWKQVMEGESREISIGSWCDVSKVRSIDDGEMSLQWRIIDFQPRLRLVTSSLAWVRASSSVPMGQYELWESSLWN